MGFFDKVGGFLDAFTNQMDKQAERKLDEYNRGSKNVTDEKAMQNADYLSKRLNQKSCARCGSAVISNTSDYCTRCRKELGLN